VIAPFRAFVLLAAPLAGAAACAGAATATIPDATEPVGGAADLPGPPLVVELATGRPHVVRLAAPAPVTGEGRLQVTSATPAAMASIDDGEPLPLPLAMQVTAGPHQVVVTCGDGSDETFNVVIESTTAVHLRVCSRRDMP
jgi:hypothetical protein